MLPVSTEVARAGTAVAPALDPAQTKACQYCGETIMQAAIKCRFCNSNLNELVPAAGQGGVRVTAPGSGAPHSIVIQNVQSVGPGYGYREIKNPGIALLLAFLFPGAGQFYNGHAGKGILVLCTCWMLLPVVWSWFDAYTSAKRINRVGF